MIRGGQPMATNADNGRPEDAIHAAELALGEDDLDTAENALLEAISRIRKNRQRHNGGDGP